MPRFDRSAGSSSWGSDHTCALRSRPPVLPPKIGLGHEGSSAGADHFSVFFSAVSATAALRICGRGAAAGDWRRGVPAKPRWAVQGRCAVCIAVIMACREEDVCRCGR
jgi:hypothetical protein